jgi:hypothetical protein
VSTRDRDYHQSFDFFFFRYNSRDHPIPFHKAIDLGKPPKKLTGQQAPDIEEAYVSFMSTFSAR